MAALGDWKAGAVYPAFGATNGRAINGVEPLAVWDFANGRASHELDYARPSVGHSIGPDGRFVATVANQIRRDYRHGSPLALFEPSATNKVPVSAAYVGNGWFSEVATISDFGGDYFGVFGGVRVAGNGEAWHRYGPIINMIAGGSYHATAWYIAGTSPQFRIGTKTHAHADGLNSSSIIAGPVGALVSSVAGEAVDITNIRNTDMGGGLYRIEFDMVANAAGNYFLGMGPNVPNVGADVIVLGAQVTDLDGYSSYIATTGAPMTRQQDSVSLPVPDLFPFRVAEEVAEMRDATRLNGFACARTGDANAATITYNGTQGNLYRVYHEAAPESLVAGQWYRLSWDLDATNSNGTVNLAIAPSDLFNEKVYYRNDTTGSFEIDFQWLGADGALMFQSSVPNEGDAGYSFKISNIRCHRLSSSLDAGYWLVVPRLAAGDLLESYSRLFWGKENGDANNSFRIEYPSTEAEVQLIKRIGGEYLSIRAPWEKDKVSGLAMRQDAAGAALIVRYADGSLFKHEKFGAGVSNNSTFILGGDTSRASWPSYLMLDEMRIYPPDCATLDQMAEILGAMG
ncbi:MAG: hypothetical protein HWE26_13645 [Alteromonadaceae bacterium]|nr:hypothetical protein [Alteromonadaceae bacterium]